MNLDSLKEEQKKQVEELVNKFNEENKGKIKWWIIPILSPFKTKNPGYLIKVQEDNYQRMDTHPPLAMNFDSESEAEAYLQLYSYRQRIFNEGVKQVNDLIDNLKTVIVDKLEKLEFITEYDWSRVFKDFNESRKNGYLMSLTENSTENVEKTLD